MSKESLGEVVLYARSGRESRTWPRRHNRISDTTGKRYTTVQGLDTSGWEWRVGEGALLRTDPLGSKLRRRALGTSVPRQTICRGSLRKTSAACTEVTSEHRSHLADQAEGGDLNLCDPK